MDEPRIFGHFLAIMDILRSEVSRAIFEKNAYN